MAGLITGKLIVALDVDSKERAERLVERLYPTVKFFKVGSQLFTGSGPDVVNMITKIGANAFLDLKFHDIPNTVKNAVETAAKLKVYMATVHLAGGKKMLEAAVSVANKPKIVGVTLLTSQDEKNAKSKVLELAKSAKDVGLDGVVCSVHEAVAVREACGEDFIIVTPGVRLKSIFSDDQARTATPKEAIQAGADFIVVGRPITQAQDPLAAAEDILKDIE